MLLVIVNVNVCRKWVPPNYYVTPLEERARELGSDPQQLCKTMIMENKAFDEVKVLTVRAIAMWSDIPSTTV